MSAPREEEAEPKPAGESWEDAVRDFQRSLVLRGRKVSGIARYLSCVKRFVKWAEGKKLTPDDLRNSQTPVEVIDEFREALKAEGVKQPNLFTVLSAAKGLMTMLRGEDDPLADAEREQTMKEKQARERGERGEEIDAELEEEAAEPAEPGDDPEAEAEQVSIPVRTSQRGSTINLKIGAAPQRQRRQPGAGAPFRAADPLNRLFPPEDTAKVRIYKRARDGKISVVNEYTAREVGGNPYPFVKKYVDPNFKDPSGQTTYLIYKVAADNRDMGAPIEVNVESEPTQQADDPLDQVQRTLNLLNDMRETESQRTSEMREVLDLAKQRIASSQSTGMNDILMLGMMQRMFEGKSDGHSLETALKLLKQLNPSALGGELGAPPAPPPAPSHHPLEPVVVKLLDAQLQKPESPRQEKSVIDQLKELVALKEFFAPRADPVVELLREELRQIREQLKGPPPGSFMGTLDQIKQVADGIKSVAPMFNMGGLAGIVQGIFSSPIAKEIASGIGASVKQAMAQQAGARAPQPQPVPALPAPPPAGVAASAPAQPPPPEPTLQTPEAALLHMRTLHQAKDEQEQVASTCGALKAHFDNPEWRPRLTPALQAMAMGNLGVARQMVREFVMPIRPDLAHDIFVEKVVQAMLEMLKAAMGGWAPTQTVAAATAPAPASTSGPTGPEQQPAQEVPAPPAEAQEQLATEPPKAS